MGVRCTTTLLDRFLKDSSLQAKRDCAKSPKHIVNNKINPTNLKAGRNKKKRRTTSNSCFFLCENKRLIMEYRKYILN